MNEGYIEKVPKMLMEINRVLSKENLRPSERKRFLDMRKYLGGVLSSLAFKDYRRELEIEADRRIEKDLPAISGESLSHHIGPRIPDQYGGVKTYGRDTLAVPTRKFHPNKNYDMDRGLLRRLLLGGRPNRI